MRATGNAHLKSKVSGNGWEQAINDHLVTTRTHDVEEGGTPWPLEVVRKIKAALATGGFWYWLLLQDLAFWSPLAIQLCLGGGRKRRWSRTASTEQRPLLSILILCPTTAAGIQFCLLCCQPEPMPRSLTARAPLSTQRRPCRPAAWLGKTIHMVSRAYRFPLPSITPHESYRQCPSEKQLFPARNVLS